MLGLRVSVPVITRRFDSAEVFRSSRSVVLCAAKGPRPRYPRVWKSTKRIGTVSKSAKLVECVKGLSNVKEEVYGALDSFVAWELEFPLIAVKKALKTLENQKEWKRVIQVTKWMLSKGQGRTMGSYFTLLNALAEEGRLDEAEELWNKLFSDNLEATPRIFFDKMISIYHKRGMHEQMFEIFADMEELGVRPTASTVSMIGTVFQEVGMLDKYDKLVKKYPPPKWEYRRVKGKRARIRTDQLYGSNSTNGALSRDSDGTGEDPEQLNEQEGEEERMTEADDAEMSLDKEEGLNESSSTSNEVSIQERML